MAEKMRDIAEYIQVICISHLPQVASMSDHHLLIIKHPMMIAQQLKLKN